MADRLGRLLLVTLEAARLDADPDRQRPEKSESARLAASSASGLRRLMLLLLRFCYWKRTWVRWEARVVAHEGGPYTRWICAEYR